MYVWTGRNEEEDTNTGCSFDAGVDKIFALGCQACLFSFVLQDGTRSRTANLLLFGLFSLVEISQELVTEDKLGTSRFDTHLIESNDA